jgi:hypothetical protein
MVMKLIRQNYMAAISQLHQAEMKELLMGFIGSLNTGGDTNEACASISLSCKTKADWIAFASAAKADVPKPSALQKSKAAIGLKGSDPTGKKEKSNENALRVAEVCPVRHSTESQLMRSYIKKQFPK